MGFHPKWRANFGRRKDLRIQDIVVHTETWDYLSTPNFGFQSEMKMVFYEHYDHHPHNFDIFFGCINMIVVLSSHAIGKKLICRCLFIWRSLVIFILLLILSTQLVEDSSTVLEAYCFIFNEEKYAWLINLKHKNSDQLCSRDNTCMFKSYPAKKL